VSELFKNQTAIISGGLGDIGRAIALEFASHGASIALGDIRPVEDSKNFLDELKRRNVAAHYQQVDVADAAQVREWVDSVEKSLAVARLIIPNAAGFTLARICEMTPEQWSRELRVNLDGAFHLAQFGANRLLHHGESGRIVFVGSWAAHAPHLAIPAYCVSKAGLRMLCKCMALELAAQGILVNEVAPGYVDAGLSRRTWEDDPTRRKLALKRVPVQSLVQAREVAQQVIHLCHPDNQNITGSTLLIDGGLSLLSL
jgi:glucose 1-dehydrogenase